VSQTLISGSGDLAGTTFTISGASFASAHVEAGGILVLGSPIDGCFPVVSVNSATVLVTSVMYDGLFPESGSGVASPITSASGVPYAVRTFGAQRQVVSDLLRRAAGVGPESALVDATIVNAESLRRVCVLGTLQMIYSILAAAAAEPANLETRASFYELAYRRALARVRVEIDTNGDGKGDVVRLLNVLDLRRV